MSNRVTKCDHGVEAPFRCLQCAPMGTRAGDSMPKVGQEFLEAVKARDWDIYKHPALAAPYGKKPLPDDSAARKEVPMATGLLDYFPDALAAVAHLSFLGNQKHNPGQSLHWSRDKSTDHADCIVRHLAERGGVDPDGNRHSVMLAWRALANLQVELEKDLGLPMSRASKAAQAT